MPFTNYTPPIKKCNDPEHNPPVMVVLPPGTHTYQCPSCGETQILEIPEVNL